jgi:hypothetical protein
MRLPPCQATPGLSRTVPLSNGKLKAIGIGRQTKYRTLNQLEDTGAITIKFQNGRAPWVTLHWFP